MSLVRPRPQRDREVELNDAAALRRHLMRSGMSGLWQVSGSSTLSWEESIRRDLYYAENWSMLGDLITLWLTSCCNRNVQRSILCHLGRVRKA